MLNRLFVGFSIIKNFNSTHQLTPRITGNDSVGYKWFKMVYSRGLTPNPGLKISIQFESGLKISNKFNNINTNLERNLVLSI